MAFAKSTGSFPRKRESLFAARPVFARNGDPRFRGDDAGGGVGQRAATNVLMVRCEPQANLEPRAVYRRGSFEARSSRTFAPQDEVGAREASFTPLLNHRVIPANAGIQYAQRRRVCLDRSYIPSTHRVLDPGFRRDDAVDAVRQQQRNQRTHGEVRPRTDNRNHPKIEPRRSRTGALDDLEVLRRIA